MKLKFFIGIAISLLFLFLALRNVSYGKLMLSLQNANYFYLIPAVILVILTMWFRAIRWRYLLQPIKMVKNHSLFSAVMIGFMANNVLPARIGEFVRAYAIGRKENLSKSLSLATIVVERIFDGFTLLTFLLGTLIFSPLPAWVKKAGISAFIFYILIIVFLILLKRYKENMLKFMNYILSPISKNLSLKTDELLTSFIAGFDILKDKKQIALILLYSFLVWTTYGVLTLLVFIAFNFNLPLYAPFLLTVILTFGVMIPSSPGYVGTYQFFCVTGLALWGIKESDALGFSLVYHAGQYVPITALGLFYLWKENMSLKEIKSEEEQQDNFFS
ncbi:MAG: lysylphosphatidylglycerol synthase transmembrane domain-containing protein [Pseudomonadota bacterium]